MCVVCSIISTTMSAPSFRLQPLWSPLLTNQGLGFAATLCSWNLQALNRLWASEKPEFVSSTWSLSSLACCISTSFSLTDVLTSLSMCQLLGDCWMASTDSRGKAWVTSPSSMLLSCIIMMIEWAPSWALVSLLLTALLPSIAISLSTRELAVQKGSPLYVVDILELLLVRIYCTKFYGESTYSIEIRKPSAHYSAPNINVGISTCSTYGYFEEILWADFLNINPIKTKLMYFVQLQYSTKFSSVLPYNTQ